MIKLIEVTAYYGNPLNKPMAVNIFFIEYYEDVTTTEYSYTRIHLNGGQTLAVKESYDDIRTRIEAWDD